MTELKIILYKQIGIGFLARQDIQILNFKYHISLSSRIKIYSQYILEKSK